MHLIRRQGETLRLPDRFVDMRLLDLVIRVVNDDVALSLTGKNAGAVQNAVNAFPFEIASGGLVCVAERLFQCVGDGLVIDNVAFADASLRRGLSESEDHRVARLVACPVEGADLRGADFDACNDIFFVECHSDSISFRFRVSCCR